jgi:hypothetical protein
MLSTDEEMQYHHHREINEDDMDNNLSKLIPLLAGSFSPLGGLLTVMNRRLNEAKPDEARRAVHENALIWGVTGLLGTLITSLGHLYAVACGLYSVSFLIQTYLFVARPGAASCSEAAMYSIQTLLFLSVLVTSFVFSMFHRTIAL